MATSTFDFTRDVLKVGGFVIGGYADTDDAVVIARRNPGTLLKSGADGDSVFTKIPDKTGTVTIKLLASSASNAVLSGIELIGVPVAVYQIDQDDTPLFTSLKAMVEKVPDSSRGKALGSIDWVILCAETDFIHRGLNETFPPLV